MVNFEVAKTSCHKASKRNQDFEKSKEKEEAYRRASFQIIEKSGFVSQLVLEKRFN